MNMQTTTTSTDDTASRAEVVAEPDEKAEPRQLAPEEEERDPEEAGYGYGV